MMLSSLTSTRFNTGLIRCLLDSIFFKMTQIRLIFLNNNYPPRIIFKEFIEKFIKYETWLNTDKNIEGYENKIYFTPVY